ncbi:hypothetical protein [Larkinella soli]|uniref:hypothetical protein n=1 Tax=Larkinella soli TaxID=1770527 RepID=UPI000FFBFFD3|nr:hypothetical protein [Larkinella soli]
MLDLTQLHSLLVGTVGLYPGSRPDTDYSDDAHNAPTVYLQDAHKLLRSDVLTALGPNLSAGGDLMEWYTQIEKGAINKLGLLVAGNPPARPLLEATPLHPKEGNIQGAFNKTGRFLGLRIRLPRRDTAVNLVKLGLQLSGPVTNLPLYVFHSDAATPIKTVNLTTTLSGRTAWNTADCWLYSRQGGYYLVGYFESDLPTDVRAIGAERGWNVADCNTCGGIEAEFIRTRSPYLNIEPVYVESVGTGRTLSWAEEKAVSLQTWGLNAVIEVRCDITNTLLTNKDMLTGALLHLLACDVLEELSTSDRVNSVKQQLKNEAYVALYGQGSSTSDNGLAARRDRLIKDLKAQLEKMRPACLQEESRKKIRIGSLFDAEY